MPADAGPPGAVADGATDAAREIDGGEIARACEIPSHMASEHLRMMQHCGLLARRQDGRRIYYEVSEPTVERLMECIERRFGDDEDKKADDQ